MALPHLNGTASLVDTTRTRMVTKMYPYNLRPVLIFTSILGVVWAIAMAVSNIRDMSDDAGNEKTLDLIVAILLFVVGGIELFGIGVAATQSLLLARFLAVFAPVGVVVTFASQLVNFVIHFTLKTTLINQCVNDTEGETTVDNFGGATTVINADQATSLCQDAWQRGTWSLIAWLIITTILALVFASIALAYYRQLLDPSSVRQRVTVHNNSQAFPMQPQGGFYPPPPQQNWMVPPYPGPPAGAPPPPEGFEKSDYHPEAEWAQANTLNYAPPPGSPPRGTNHNPFLATAVVPNREEDEAWERARAEGVTAHLTGHGIAPNIDTSQGYTIPNQEEDEAWERAREEGVTAHLTGHGRGRKEQTDL
ncbi:hypothetical protein P7C73_g1501, partial [Tremellales sp. Uapishka_1]